MCFFQVTSISICQIKNYHTIPYAGAFGYADDIALLAHSLQCLKQMMFICEKYASSHSITFNPKTNQNDYVVMQI